MSRVHPSSCCTQQTVEVIPERHCEGEQHADPLPGVHTDPGGAHIEHTPPLQASPPQQSPLPVQLWPRARHWHIPSTQVALPQQSGSTVQRSPDVLHLPPSPPRSSTTTTPSVGARWSSGSASSTSASPGERSAGPASLARSMTFGESATSTVSADTSIAESPVVPLSIDASNTAASPSVVDTNPAKGRTMTCAFVAASHSPLSTAQR